MKRLTILVAVMAVVLAACSPQLEDLTYVEAPQESSAVAEVIDPDSVTVYRNIDGFANINIMCVNGDAFITRSLKWADWQIIHIPAGENNLCG